MTGEDATVLSDDVHEILTESEGTGMFGNCPGPFRFTALRVTIES